MTKTDFDEHLCELQSNEISRGFYQCSMLARKLIAYGAVRISEMKLTDEKSFYDTGRMCIFLPIAKVKISDFLKALNLSICGQNYELVKKAVVELRHSGIDLINDENEYLGYNWFQYIHFNKHKDLIEMCFSCQIGWALYNLVDGFTALNLNAIGGFKSFYAFRYYEIALSWKGNKGKKGNSQGVWFFQMTEKEIRQTFKIGNDKYQGRTDNFVKKVISEPIKELNELSSDFEIEVERIKRGRETLYYKFNCSETKTKLEISKKDSEELKAKKIEINKEDDKLERLKKQHPKEWQNVLSEELKQCDLDFGDKDIVFDADWHRKVAEAHFLDMFSKNG